MPPFASIWSQQPWDQGFSKPKTDFTARDPERRALQRARRESCPTMERRATSYSGGLNLDRSNCSIDFFGCFGLGANCRSSDP